MDAVLPETVTGLRRQGGPAGELRVRLVVARECRERDALGPAGRCHLFQPVGPVAAAAEQAQDHEPRVRDHLLDMMVDRERMTELEQVGKAQARPAFGPERLGRGETGELGIGRRQDHDVARALAEIDRLARVQGGRRAGIQKMHQLLAWLPARTSVVLAERRAASAATMLP